MAETGVCLLAESFPALDEADFSRCSENLRPRALRFAAGMLADAGRAEELVQDALLCLYAQRGRYRPDAESVRRYLFRVLANLCIDEIRRRKTGGRALEGAGEMARARAARTGPADEISRRERRAAVGTAITELPERERAALLLREIGGHSYAQIAGELDTSISDVTNLIHRGRVQFTRLMRSWLD